MKKQRDLFGAQPCVVCGAEGTVTVKPLNGLPVGIVACDACRAAVQRREVGVVRCENGTLCVTDGRPKAMAVSA